MASIHCNKLKPKAHADPIINVEILKQVNLVQEIFHPLFYSPSNSKTLCLQQGITMGTQKRVDSTGKMMGEKQEKGECFTFLTFFFNLLCFPFTDSCSRRQRTSAQQNVSRNFALPQSFIFRSDAAGKDPPQLLASWNFLQQIYVNFFHGAQLKTCSAFCQNQEKEKNNM